MITTGDLKEIFRVFTEGQTTGMLPERATGVDNGIQQIETVAIVTKQALDDERKRAIGLGVFFEDNNTQNLAACLLSPLAQTLLAGEILAIKLAAERTPVERRMHIHCNLKSTETVFVKKLKKLENTGYIGIKNPELI